MQGQSVLKSAIALCLRPDIRVVPPHIVKTCHQIDQAAPDMVEILSTRTVMSCDLQRNHKTRPSTSFPSANDVRDHVHVQSRVVSKRLNLNHRLLSKECVPVSKTGTQAVMTQKHCQDAAGIRPGRMQQASDLTSLIHDAVLDSSSVQTKTAKRNRPGTSSRSTRYDRIALLNRMPDAGSNIAIDRLPIRRSLA